MPEQLGVFVGRFSPIHLGHQVIIDALLNQFGDRSLLILGSATAPQSIRHFFSYEERRSFIKQLYPNLTVAGLPDYPTDREWLLALDDLIALKKKPDEQVIFSGGCREDVEFFVNDNRAVQLYNRFDGTTPRISATEVRDALLRGCDLASYLDPRIQTAITQTFARSWATFSRR